MRIGLLMLCLLLLVAACSKEKKPSGEGVFNPLELAVDSAKLGELIEVGGLRLQAPAGWINLDSSAMQQLIGVASRDTSEMQLRPERAFKREGGGPMLLVSRFPKVVKLGPRFVPWAGEVAKVYRDQRKDVVVQEQWMSISGVEALQLYGQSAKLVHVKILLNADEPVSLDYTVPADMWPEEVRAVESSLGSLRKVYP
ncbi:MAG: hypothetical protein IPP40_09925 [bacterium]|nr:hypothetical protein [bacterium]